MIQGSSIRTVDYLLNGIPQIFPFPFGAIAVKITVKNQQDLKFLIEKLLYCGHPHHFAVAQEELSLYVSIETGPCINNKQG